jgi:GTP-binding protein LepA
MNDGDRDRAAQPGRHARPCEDRQIEEPWIKATILVPDEYLGGDAEAVQDRRGGRWS